MAEGQSSLFEQGDVLFGKLRPYLAKVHQATGPGRCTSELLVLRSRRLLPGFLKYLLLSKPLVKLVDSSTFGAKMPRADWDFIGQIMVPCPNIQEQRAIADFLDRQTAAIDALIDKRRAQLSLLDEKRLTLTTAVIISGLNPSARTKNSGLPWLAEYIPAHWAVRRLKFISPRQCVGVVVNPSHYFADEGVPFLFGNNVREGEFGLEGVRRISEESNGTLAKSMLRTGDLVVVRVGAPGVTAVIPEALDRCNCASIMIVRQAASFESQWLCYAMNSRIGRCQVEAVRYGAAQEQFNISDAVNFTFPVPPLEEQRAIVANLDAEVAVIARTCASIEAEMKLLAEYRQALISAAVTGQALRRIPAGRLRPPCPMPFSPPSFAPGK